MPAIQFSGRFHQNPLLQHAARHYNGGSQPWSLTTWAVAAAAAHPEHFEAVTSHLDVRGPIR